MLRIGNALFKRTDPALAVALAAIHGSKIRPFCTCCQNGIAMYVVKLAGQYAVKRMPNTGPDHSPDCDSYESPAALSGLGQLMENAINEDVETGFTTLKLGFSLNKVSAKRTQSSAISKKDSAKTDGNKLSLRSTLHYLWEHAGFNRWSPAMDGKRSWFVIRKYLLQAAENTIVKGEALAERMYIPEPFSVQKKGEIAGRRVLEMSKAAVLSEGRHQLMIVVGEVAEIGKSRFGFKMRFKHVPDCDFMMNEDLHKRLQNRFAIEIALWDASGIQDTHLMAIGTFGVGGTGVPAFEEIALMVVSRDWIPFEDQFELMLLSALAENQRRFTKGLRYNLETAKPLATAVLSDTAPQPTAMYVVPLGADDTFHQALGQLIDSSKLQSWRWQVGSTEMPPLPPALSSVTCCR